MYSKLLLHADLHRESVGVPSGAAVHLVPGLGLEAADGILDGARHYVVDSRLAVRGRRTLEEYELRCPFPDLKGFLERVILFPSVENLIPDRNQIKAFVLFECHNFLSIFASEKPSVRFLCN